MTHKIILINDKVYIHLIGILPLIWVLTYPNILNCLYYILVFFFNGELLRYSM